MRDSKVLVARMAQMQVARNGETLKAIMGSCVGIAILWPKRGVYALSHCLLGESPATSSELSAKYVSDAIPMMLEALGVEDRRDRRALEAVVVGGGTMLQDSGNPGGEEIGPSNLLAAKKHLELNRVTIRHMQSADGNASQLFVDGGTGEYDIVLIPKLKVDKGMARRSERSQAQRAGRA